MFSSLSFKKKFYYSLALFGLIVFGLYQKNFSQIIILSKELKTIEEKNGNAFKDKSNAEVLSNQIKVIEDLIGDSDAKPDYVQREIIDFISNSPLEHSIIKIQPIHSIPTGEFIINSFAITIEGSFHQLIMLLKAIEEDLFLTKVVSTRLYTNENYRMGRKELFMDIIFQSYEKI